jgi:hypothetical protein
MTTEQITKINEILSEISELEKELELVENEIQDETFYCENDSFHNKGYLKSAKERKGLIESLIKTKKARLIWI